MVLDLVSIPESSSRLPLTKALLGHATRVVWHSELKLSTRGGGMSIRGIPRAVCLVEWLNIPVPIYAVIRTYYVMGTWHIGSAQQYVSELPARVCC